MSEPQQITALLQKIAAGDHKAEEELFAAVYGQLRSLAGWFLRRERPGHTLQPTALVNEAYLRMLGGLGKDWASHTHFFSVAAKAMRSILVDHARQRGAAKRIKVPNVLGNSKVSFSDDELTAVLAIDDALHRMEKVEPRPAKVVELRFFGGLTEEEISLVLDLSVRTVKRDWIVAKTWLRAEL